MCPLMGDKNCMVYREKRAKLGNHLWEMSAYQEVPTHGKCLPMEGSVFVRHYGRCPLMGVSTNGKFPLKGHVRLREVSAYGRHEMSSL